MGISDEPDPNEQPGPEPDMSEKMSAEQLAEEWFRAQELEATDGPGENSKNGMWEEDWRPKSAAPQLAYVAGYSRGKAEAEEMSLREELPLTLEQEATSWEYHNFQWREFQELPMDKLWIVRQTIEKAFLAGIEHERNRQHSIRCEANLAEYLASTTAGVQVKDKKP
jgi:hypothetical protein